MQPSMKHTKDSICGQTLPLCDEMLSIQNTLYQHTGGVSQNNSGEGFIPAFYNQLTGKVAISCFADGRLAPIHLLEGLPRTWVIEVDDSGLPILAHESVKAGFLRNGRFFTREEVAALLS